MAWTSVLRMLRRMVAIFQEKVMEMRAMLRPKLQSTLLTLLRCNFRES